MSPNKLHASYQGALVGLGNDSPSFSPNWGTRVGLGDGSLVSISSYQGAWVGLGDGSLVSTSSYEGEGVGIGVGSPVSVASSKRFVSKFTLGRRMKSEAGSKVFGCSQYV